MTGCMFLTQRTIKLVVEGEHSEEVETTLESLKKQSSDQSCSFAISMIYQTLLNRQFNYLQMTACYIERSKQLKIIIFYKLTWKV